MKLPPLDFEKPIAELEEKLADLKKHSRANDINFDHEVRRMEGKIEETKRAIYENLTAWQRVQIARHPARPFALDYLQLSFTNFIELHGDRRFAEDRAMPGGFATIGDHKCAVIGHQKGRELKENIRRNFGCANPGGLPQGPAAHAARGEIRAAFRGAHRHARGVSRRRRRGAAHLRGHRREPARDDGAADADRGGGHRRRRQRRRARHRRGGSRAHAGERLLLGDLARGLRGDSLEASQARARGGGGAQAHRARFARSSSSSTGSFPSRWAARIRTTRQPLPISRRPCSSSSTN